VLSLRDTLADVSQRSSEVQLFGDTVTYLAKTAVKRVAPGSLTEYVTVIPNVSTKLVLTDY
jgi:hypothetical protein